MPSSVPHKASLPLIETTLKHSNIFKDLPFPLHTELIKICDWIKLKRGQYLFHEGITSTGFYIVNQGIINLHKNSSQGKELVIKVFKKGESFAEATSTVFSTYQANAIAEQDCELVHVRKNEFQPLLESTPILAKRLNAAISLHLSELVSHLEEIQFFTPENRLARWIFRQTKLSPNCSKTTVLRWDRPKHCIASELDMTSETFSRKLRSLESKKIITNCGNSIRIINANALSRLANPI